MIAVSSDFKNAMKQPVKELQAFITGDDVEISDETDLIEFKISADSGLCKTTMRKLEAKILGNYDLLGQWVHVGFSVKLPDGTFEPLDYGSFLITETTSAKDTEVTTITGYDKMINAMTKYTPLNIEYPVTLYNYTVALCNACGLSLENQSLPSMNNWSITKELWENIDGITYRDIFEQIAQATGTTVIITNEDEILFKTLTNTGEELTYDNMFKLKLEPKYGEINSVVLSRTPQEDNIYKQDEESIEDNGLTEWKIENNEIIDKDRDNALDPIYNAMHGIEFYPFEITTEGLGWYEIGDSFDIINEYGDVFSTSLFNFSITIDGGIKETLKTVAETKTKTQYQYATSITRRIKNTEIIVDKQEQNIQSLVTDMYDENGQINEKFTKVYQDIDNIVNSVQNSGGANLIQNSVMFAYDSEGIPNNWEVTGSGTLEINSSSEAMSNGSLSGHIFTLNNKTVRQTIKVKANDETDPNKTYYSFCTKIKKNVTGSCYVRLYNSNEEYRIDIPAGESAFYNEYEISKLLPKDDYYIIEFYGSADSDATFTDNMFSIGDYKSQWTQANGEVMNTQVNINLDGILIKSSVYLGDYTIVSPLEFAGYSNINGTITKVFSLNKDTTLVKKLGAEEEIAMPPIKIVPRTEGNIQGWAFVPTVEEV